MYLQHNKGLPSFCSLTHGHHHVNRVLRLLLVGPQDVLMPYLSATIDRARAGNHATDHTP